MKKPKIDWEFTNKGRKYKIALDLEITSLFEDSFHCFLEDDSGSFRLLKSPSFIGIFNIEEVKKAIENFVIKKGDIITIKIEKKNGS